LQLASELWPAKIDEDDSEGDPDESLSIEAQIASEVSAMKRPRAEQRFGTFNGVVGHPPLKNISQLSNEHAVL
jgi:hypothetical protein